MKNKFLVMAVLIIMIGSGVVTAMRPQSDPITPIDGIVNGDDQQMGVWITDINGIPLHQTEQFGKFAIFEAGGI